MLVLAALTLVLVLVLVPALVLVIVCGSRSLIGHSQGMAGGAVGSGNNGV